MKRFLLSLFLIAVLSYGMEQDVHDPHCLIHDYFHDEQLTQWVKNCESSLIMQECKLGKLFLIDQKPSFISQAKERFNWWAYSQSTVASTRPQILLALKGWKASSKDIYCTCESTITDEQLITRVRVYLKKKFDGTGTDNEKLICAIVLHDLYALSKLLERGATGDFSSEVGGLFKLTNTINAAFYLAEMVRHYEDSSNPDHTRWQSILKKLYSKRAHLFEVKQVINDHHIQTPISILERSHNRFVHQERSWQTGFEIVQNDRE